MWDVKIEVLVWQLVDSKSSKDLLEMSDINYEEITKHKKGAYQSERI